MYSMTKFKIYNFTPRKGVVDRINNILADIVELAPMEASCKAAIERFGDCFVFELTLRTSSEIFHSQFKVDVRNILCRQRYWQVEMVLRLHDEVSEQLVGWRHKRFAA